MDADRAAELLALVEAGRSALRTEERDAELPVSHRYSEIERAFEWHLDKGDDAAAARLSCALVSYWMATGQIETGSRWFQRLLAVPREPAEVWARALHDHGYLVFWAGDHGVAQAQFEASRVMAEVLNESSIEALALAGLARVALNSDVDHAIGLLRRALEITAHDQAQSDGRSSALHVLGVALQMSGDLTGARTVIAERLERARREKDLFVVWTESANLSMVERQLGNLDVAEQLSRQAVASEIASSRDLFLAWTLNGLAAVTAAQGRLVRAATILSAATALLAAAGGDWPPDERQQYAATVEIVGAGLPDADLDAARARGAAMTREAAVEFTLNDPTPAQPQR